MTPDDYCVNVCGGKCCKAWDENRKVIFKCPHQTKRGACSIYDSWKHKETCGQYFKEVDNLLISIKEALDRNLVPEWIAEQCCVAHPELLKEPYMIYEDTYQIVKVSKQLIFDTLAQDPNFGSLFSDKTVADLESYGPGTDASFLEFTFSIKPVNETLSERKVIRVLKGAILNLLTIVDPVNFQGKTLTQLKHYGDNTEDPDYVDFTFKL